MTLATDSKLESLKQARYVFAVTLGLNLLVALGKLFWGYTTHTLSMVADGFHSLLDAASNIVGILGLNMSMQPADHDHPYGHRKFEALASMVISFMIFLTCFEILQRVADRILNAGEVPEVSLTSYAVMIITMLINIFVTRYESAKGKALNNDLLLSDAQHTLSDIFASASVIVSLVAIQLHIAWLDILVALFLVALIFKAGFGILVVHWGALSDEAVLDPEDVEKIVLSVPGVKGCHKIRSRGMRNHIFMDLHIQVDPSLTVKEAHQISYQVESTLEKAFEGDIYDVLVHIEEAE